MVLIKEFDRFLNFSTVFNLICIRMVLLATHLYGLINIFCDLLKRFTNIREND